MSDNVTKNKGGRPVGYRRDPDPEEEREVAKLLELTPEEREKAYASKALAFGDEAATRLRGRLDYLVQRNLSPVIDAPSISKKAVKRKAPAAKAPSTPKPSPLPKATPPPSKKPKPAVVAKAAPPPAVKAIATASLPAVSKTEEIPLLTRGVQVTLEDKNEFRKNVIFAEGEEVLLSVEGQGTKSISFDKVRIGNVIRDKRTEVFATVVGIGKWTTERGWH